MEREHGVDRAKAIAILCVVAIHCQTPFTFGGTDLVARLFIILMEWGVPAFFFLGGYVRARTTPYPPRTTRRWLVRMLPTYLLASLLALLTRRYAFDQSVMRAIVPFDLLTGSAWGIYYFVPVFLGVLLCSHAIARWPRLVPWVATASIASLVLTRWDPNLDPLWRALSLHGMTRSPLFWWGYFFAGWIVRLKLERAPRRPIAVLSAIIAIVCVFALLNTGAPMARALARVGVAIAIPTALVFGSSRPLGAATALLAEYSYEVYLFHFFAIAVASHLGPSNPGTAMSIVLWAIALTSGLGAGIITRQVLQRPLSAIE